MTKKNEPSVNGSGPLQESVATRNQVAIVGLPRNGHESSWTPASPICKNDDPDLPPLSEEDQRELCSFLAKQQVLVDVTLGCIRGNHPGAHFFGPPGVSKTYTINNTLRQYGAHWQLHQRITAKPLYLELEQNPGAVHVIDDCEQLFAERSALTLLRSALGGERIKGRRERLVCYSVAGAKARVLEHYFHGAVIFTSNRPLSDERPEVRAIMSRIPSIGFSPTDREIRALMRHVARRGYSGEGGSTSAQECVEVIEYVIALAGELKCRLDLRWIEHGYAHYLTHAQGGSVDWRDMVKFHMMNTLTYFDHGQPGNASRATGRPQAGSIDQTAVALEIASMPGLTARERLSLWEERTGQSRANYYRWLRKGRGGITN